MADGLAQLEAADLLSAVLVLLLIPRTARIRPARVKDDSKATHFFEGSGQAFGRSRNQSAFALGCQNTSQTAVGDVDIKKTTTHCWIALAGAGPEVKL